MSLDKMERVIGGTGLSIGTHLAMESIFDIPTYDVDREAPPKVNLADYNYFMFNLYTILRNITNSYTERDKLKILTDKQLESVLMQEIDLLRIYFSNFPSCKFIIYFPDYSKPLRQLNFGKGDKPSAKMLDFTNMDTVLRKFIKKENGGIKNVVTKTSYLFPKMDGDIIVMTSYPMDLLNKGRISLFESHTGKLKTRSQFYTKFHSPGGADMSNIPFIEDMLYIFGDNAIVKGLNIALKRKVLEVAAQKNWTYKTTHEKVKYDIEEVLELKPTYKQIRRVYG